MLARRQKVSLSLPLAVRRVVDNFFAECARARRRLLPRRARHRGAARARHRGALLPGHPPRRAGGRRHPPGDLRPGDRHEPGLLRADHDRRGALAADHRHHAGAVGGRLVGVDGAPQRADADRRASRSSSVTSPKLTGAGAGRRAAGASCRSWRSAAAPRAEPREPGPDRRGERPGLREPARGADRAGLHPRGRRAAAIFGRLVERSFDARGGGSGRGRR